RSVVFFLQAEDGIRDWSVTGVQTCALPIWPGARCARGRALVRTRAQRAPGRAEAARALCDRGRRRALRRERRMAALRARGPARRSEERRVGEEGRSRGATCEHRQADIDTGE